MTDPHVKVLAYSVDASWADSPSRSSKLHAAADPNNEHSSAACSDRIPLNVDMGGFDPEQVRHELCRKPACQRAFFPDTAPASRTSGKPDRRALPAGADRRTDRRRRRDKLNAELARAERERKDRAFEKAIETWDTTEVLELYLNPDTKGFRKLVLCNEINARIPARRKG